MPPAEERCDGIPRQARQSHNGAHLLTCARHGIARWASLPPHPLSSHRKLELL